MILRVKTKGGEVTAMVADNIEAVCFMRDLQKQGVKCLRWEVIR